MAVLATLVLLLSAMVATVVVWSVVRRPPPDPVGSRAEVRILVRAARRRAGAAVAVSGVLCAALLIATPLMPRLLGLPALLAAPLAATAGLVVYSAIPPRVVPVAETSERYASLARRTPTTYVWRPGAVTVLALVVAQIGFLLFTGVTSRADEVGRYRQIGFDSGAQGSAAGPYAGWFYAVPLLAATVLLAAATLIAIRRVSSTPALPWADLEDIDTAWRRASTRVIIAISAASVLFQFGGVAVFSGGAIRRAYFDGVAPGWKPAGVGMETAGFLLILASVVALALAAIWAAALPYPNGSVGRATGERPATAPQALS